MSCNVCYTCEKGIIPTITAEEMKAVKDIPKEWQKPADDGCQSCFSCQRCVVAQQPCLNCYTAQKV